MEKAPQKKKGPKYPTPARRTMEVIESLQHDLLSQPFALAQHSSPSRAQSQVFSSSQKLHSRGPPGPGPFEIAGRIAKLLKVPNVSFGHTHHCDLRSFEDYPGKYSNTGTWIPNPGPWDSFKPYSRQFTFAIIRGTDMKLRRWNSETGKWEPVLMLEDYHPTPFERLLAEGETKPTLSEDG